MKLIDAEALTDELNVLWQCRRTWAEGLPVVRLKDVNDLIEAIPKIEVVPVEDGRYIRAGEVSAIVEDGEPVGFYRPEGPEESEAEHRAEVFERMAFKLGEEKKILLKIVRKVVGCRWCENHKKKSNEEPCRSCGILASNFSPDFEKIEREIEK